MKLHPVFGSPYHQIDFVSQGYGNEREKRSRMNQLTTRVRSVYSEESILEPNRGICIPEDQDSSSTRCKVADFLDLLLLELR